LLSLLLGGVGAVLLVLFRAPIGRWMLGQAQNTGAALLVGAALIFTLLAATFTSTLNAHPPHKGVGKGRCSHKFPKQSGDNYSRMEIGCSRGSSRRSFGYGN
jgi:hypothetical protein